MQKRSAKEYDANRCRLCNL